MQERVSFHTQKVINVHHKQTNIVSPLTRCLGPCFFLQSDSTCSINLVYLDEPCKFFARESPAVCIVQALFTKSEETVLRAFENSVAQMMVKQHQKLPLILLTALQQCIRLSIKVRSSIRMTRELVCVHNDTGYRKSTTLRTRVWRTYLKMSWNWYCPTYYARIKNI